MAYIDYFLVHWGETKMWYSIPEQKEAGVDVDVYACNQRAGEFVGGLES